MNQPASKSTSTARAVDLAEGLFPHQVEGLAFLLGRKRSILADDMGLGKTRQSILAMVETTARGPWLVVCPASVKQNWRREIHAVLGVETPVAVIDHKNPLADEWSSWIIINYDIVKKHLPDLQAAPLTGIVCDEAHYLKNRNSQRSKAVRAIINDSPDDVIVHCLTGTPLTNRPRDLFPLLQIVNHSLGRSFLSFAKRYCDAVRGEYGWITDGASNIEELTVQLHGTMLRRRKDDVLDLPAKIRSWMPVEIPDGTGRKDAQNFLAAVVQAHQAEQGRSVDSPVALMSKLAPNRKKVAIAKVKNTLSFVDDILEQDEKVVIYSCFTKPTSLMADHFGDVCRVLTGKTPTNKRQGVVDEFQNDPSVRVLIANIIAGGVGINLTAANHVVFNDLDWVPANHWQAEDRAYRIGQKRTVNVYYFAAAGTLDEFVSEVLRAKSQIVEAVVEGKAVAVDGAETADVLTELRNLLAGVDQDADDRDLIDSLLQRTRARYADSPANAEKPPVNTSVTPEALEALARALQRPDSVRYRLANSKGDGDYVLEVDSGDVSCSCRGFEFRGQCKHARTLKDSLASTGTAPNEYSLVANS